MIFIIIILIISIILVFKGVELYKDFSITKNLEKLNYSNNSIETIKEVELDTFIIESSYESDKLDEAFNDEEYDI